MRKSINKWFKALTITALISGMTWSCQEEKPEIKIPTPIIPQKEFRYVETLAPDTTVFNEGDSIVFSIRTIPYNLISRDSITVQISDTAGAAYKYADVKSCSMNADSVWNIVIRLRYGMEDGDIISVMLDDRDTVLYSEPTVLKIIRKAPPVFYSMAVLNDSISGYLMKGEATLRLRTDPWDMLFNDSTFQFTITDDQGNPSDNLVTITGRDFQPEDSCWAIRFTLVDNTMEDISVRARLACPDTVMLSEPYYFTLVSFKMRSVKTGNNLEMKYDGNTDTYTYCFPTRTDFSAQKFLFTHSGHRVTVGDSVLVEKEYNVLNVQKPIKVSVWKYDVHKDYTIKLTNTGLPVVRIYTNGQSVTRRDTWVDNNTIRIELPDGTVAFQSDSLSLKGRGNGTWTETNKKPYALKLNSKVKILGMDKSKRWCLLANYKDRTLLRNDAAFWLSRHTDMPYTVKGRYVELVWNDKHMGNYYLCQQIRIENGRVEIADPDLNDPANGGMLVVIDDFLGYSSNDRKDKSPMIGFRSTGSSSRYKLPYVLKDPEEDENGNPLTSSSATFKYLQNYVKNMEDAIYTSDQSDKWMDYLDIDRAVDYVLIQEITMNHDSYNTWPNAGPHSAYLYKDAGGLLCYGPVWDFDYHTFTLYNDAAYSSPWGGQNSGENSRIKQWELLKMDNKGNNKYYFADLVKRSRKFKDCLKERWNEYKYVWRDSLPVYIDMMADSIRVSESYNRQIWTETGGSINSNTNYKQNGDWNLTFQEAVDALKTAFRKRWEWIDQNLPTLCM